MAAQNAACQAVGLGNQPEQQVLAADVVVAERRGFGDGELEGRDRGIAEARPWPVRSGRRGSRRADLMDCFYNPTGVIKGVIDTAQRSEAA